MEQKQPFHKRIKQDLDELRLQVKLGETEAVDYIEEKKEELAEFVDQTRDHLKDVKDPEKAKEKAKEARRALDELRLQLKLGRMESSDAYHEQKEKIESALSNTRKKLGDLRNATGDAMSKSRRSFAYRAGAFGAKLELLALGLGSGKIEDDEELGLRQKEVNAALEEWAGRLEGATDLASEEAHEAWDTLKKKIGNLAK